MQPRPLRWDDAGRVAALMGRWRAARLPQDRIRVGHMYWALRGGDPIAGAWVWEGRGTAGDGGIAAFAWLDGPSHDDVLLDPHDTAPALDEALGWLEARARERGRIALGVVAVDGDNKRERVLDSRGYERSREGDVRLWRALGAPTEVAAASLPGCYAFRAVDDRDGLAQRSSVVGRSFGGPPLAPDAWRILAERLPGYMPGLDVLVTTHDGEGAAAATLWLDEASGCAEIEAVGTVPPHRRRGLATAVISEGLRRLCALGARSAAVQTTIANGPAIALYRDLGFQVVAHDHAWVKRI